MKVREVMTANPETCSAFDFLTTAGVRMWDRDCGILPVVEEGRVVGVITDRDVCMSLTLGSGAAANVTVASVMKPQDLVTCGPDDDVLDALGLMDRCQVRRLVVVREGRLEGILSMDDLILSAREHPGAAGYPTEHQVVQTLKGICAHHRARIALTAR